MRRLSLPLLVLGAILVVIAVCRKSESPPGEEAAPAATAAVCAGDADCEIGSICEAGSCEAAVCPDVYDPVCGEDGNTYANPCEARAAHVAVAHPGECAQVCGGIVGVLCPEGEECDLPAGQCQVADLEGICVEIPEACPEIFDPVCGCDDVTYSNDCFRLMAGAQKDHDGECGFEEG